MNSGIYIKKIWFDDHVIKLKIDSSDGFSFFSTSVYVGHDTVGNLITELITFKDEVYGGIYDMRFGGFGPEYAGGSFQARLHFQDRGKIHISINAQSEYKDFGRKNVASEATLYLVSEPALLDNFIAELKGLHAKSIDEAKLEAI